MTADPLAYLTAALDAAEETALAATKGTWEVRSHDGPDGWEIAATVREGREWGWVVGAENGGGIYEEPDARHIAMHSPAAVLRRITAERKILARHQDDGCGDCTTCGTDGGAVEVNGITYTARDSVTFPCPTVRDLAEGWGWTPEQ